MGTVARVDNARQQVVLTDGSVVCVPTFANVHRGTQRLALSQIEPGAEVVIQLAPIPAASPEDLWRLYAFSRIVDLVLREGQFTEFMEWWGLQRIARDDQIGLDTQLVDPLVQARAGVRGLRDGDGRGGQG